MYLYRHDEGEALAVWLFDKGTVEEWSAHFEHLRVVASWSAKTGKRAACMLLPFSFERPDARRRTELARVTETPGYDPYVAFVMPNMAVRGILTMMGWVQKAPKYEMNFTGTVDEAFLWLETKRGGRLETLRTMATEAIAERERLGAPSA